MPAVPSREPFPLPQNKIAPDASQALAFESQALERICSPAQICQYERNEYSIIKLLFCQDYLKKI
jgi:hypothetical protein